MSEFWVRKIKTYFQRFDFDNDGSISQADFDGLARGFVDSGKLDEVQGNKLKGQLSRLWSKYMEGHEGEALTEEKLIATLKKQASDPSHVQLQVEPLTLAFNAIDSNADGTIHLDELEAFFEILGLDKSTATATFQAIDTDNDGALSREEFVAAGVNFFTSEDENSPAKLFWGPLI